MPFAVHCATTVSCCPPHATPDLFQPASAIAGLLGVPAGAEALPAPQGGGGSSLDFLLAAAAAAQAGEPARARPSPAQATADTARQLLARLQGGDDGESAPKRPRSR